MLTTKITFMQLSDAEWVKLENDYLTTGENTMSIAERYGVSPKAVRSHLDRRGIKRRTFKKQVDNFDWLDIESDYLSSEKTALQIATERGIHPRTVHSHFEKHNIQRKPFKEEIAKIERIISDKAQEVQFRDEFKDKGIGDPIDYANTLGNLKLVEKTVYYDLHLIHNAISDIAKDGGVRNNIESFYALIRAKDLSLTSIQRVCNIRALEAERQRKIIYENDEYEVEIDDLEKAVIDKMLENKKPDKESKKGGWNK